MALGLLDESRSRASNCFRGRKPEKFEGVELADMDDVFHIWRFECWDIRLEIPRSHALQLIDYDCNHLTLYQSDTGFESTVVIAK